MLELTTRADPISPLHWTCKSARKLATEPTRQGHPLSHTATAEMLKALGYSLQGTCKTNEGSSHPDRNAQFEDIRAQVKAFQQLAQPIVQRLCKNGAFAILMKGARAL